MALFIRKRDHSRIIFDCLELSESELHEIKTLVEEHGGECGVDYAFTIKFIHRSKYNETLHQSYRLYDIDFIRHCIEKSKILNLNDYRLGPKQVAEVCATSTFLYGSCHYAKTLSTVQVNGHSIVPDSPETSDYDVDVEDDCGAQSEDSLMSDFSSPSAVESSQNVDTKEAESSEIVDPLVKIPSNESQSVITGVYERRLPTFGASGDAPPSESSSQNCSSITDDSQGPENGQNLEGTPQETPLDWVTLKPEASENDIWATVSTDLGSLDLEADVIETGGGEQKLGKRGEPPLGTLDIAESIAQENVLAAHVTVDISESLNVTEDLAGNVTIDISDSLNVSEDNLSPAKVPLDAESLNGSEEDVFEGDVEPDVVDSSNVSQEDDVQANVEPDVVDSSNVSQEDDIQANVEPDIVDSSNVSQENVVQGNGEPDVVDSSNVSQENVVQANGEPDVWDSSNVTQENVIEANAKPDVSESSNVTQENVVEANAKPDVSESSNVTQENVVEANAKPDVSEGLNVSKEDVFEANVEPDVSDSSTVSQANVIHANVEPDVSDSSSADKENVIPSNIEPDVSEFSNVTKQGASPVRSNEPEEADKKSPARKDVDMTVVETSSPEKVAESNKPRSWISSDQILRNPRPITTKDSQQEDAALELRRDTSKACSPIRKADKLVNPMHKFKKASANNYEKQTAVGPETDAKSPLKEPNQMTCVPGNVLNSEDFSKAGPSGIRKTKKTSSCWRRKILLTESEDSDESNGTKEKNRRPLVKKTQMRRLGKMRPQENDDCLLSDDTVDIQPSPSVSKANGGTVDTVIDLTTDDEEKLPVTENKKCGRKRKSEEKIECEKIRRRRLEDNETTDDTSDSDIEATATRKKETRKPGFGRHIDDTDSDGRNPNDDDSNDSPGNEPKRVNYRSQTRRQESRTERAARLERDLWNQASPNTKQWIEAPDARPIRVPATHERFSEAERRAMIDYLLSFDNFVKEQPKGYKLWERMLEAGILRYRTVQSVHNHFKRYLLPNIEEYFDKMTEDQINQFKELKNSRRGQ